MLVWVVLDGSAVMFRTGSAIISNLLSLSCGGFVSLNCSVSVFSINK